MTRVYTITIPKGNVATAMAPAGVSGVRGALGGLLGGLKSVNIVGDLALRRNNKVIRKMVEKISVTLRDFIFPRGLVWDPELWILPMWL